jgi:cellulose synthase/poly-beta-1,6-N-acetylglucosamine synthase-like glycosyltransferase
MLPVSVCICAYNEEKNIKNVIDSLSKQHLRYVSIEEIIVVSSSSDLTDDIVLNLAKNDKRIILVREKERSGKANAINLFIERTEYEICVLVGADVVPRYDAIERLCLPFLDDCVGMTGAHIIPSNPNNNFVGFAGHTHWEMAHRISLLFPKLGETIAFRRIVDKLDPKTAVDEAYLESALTKMGKKLIYVPEAIVYNRTSATVKDLIKQRKRIHTGHLHLKQTTSYSVSTLDMKTKGKLAFGLYMDYVRGFIWMPFVVLLEIYCLLLGTYDHYIKKKNPYIWEISKSTKELDEKRINT